MLSRLFNGPVRRMHPAHGITSLLAVIAVTAALLFAAPPPAHAQADGIWITEIHYHPQSTGDGTPAYDDREHTEFVEIDNLGTTPTDISCWCFNSGIEFCFPAGTVVNPNQALVLARDAVAFNALYGFAPDGDYDGKLSNSGEVVRLSTNAGATAALVSWITSDPWPVTADGLGPSLELISQAGSNANSANWDASAAVNGTPGSLPSIPSGAPPLVTSRSYSEIAIPGQPTAISASASNTTSATLEYDINFGQNQQVPMQLIAGQWQANLPALSAGSLARFRIQATGPNGSATSPRSADSVDWWAVAAPSQQQSSVPVLDLYLDPDDWDELDDNNSDVCPCPVAVSYEDQVWTDVMARRAGGITSFDQDKLSIRLDFPDGYPFAASFLDGASDELTLDASTSDRDMIREPLGWTLMERVGFKPVRTTHVRVEQNGTYQGLYVLREEQDGRWRSRNNLDRGLMYKANPSEFAPSGAPDFGFNGYYEKKEGFDQSDADTIALSQCLDNWNSDQNALRSCMLDTVDIPAVVNEMAAMVMIRQQDQREFNFFLYRDDEQNKLWRIEPDDLDRTFGATSVNNPGLWPESFYDRCDSSSSLANEMCRGLLNVPEFRTMFNRRTRTMVDRYLADPLVIAEINQTASYIASEWDDDEDKHNRNSRSFTEIVDLLVEWVGDYVDYTRDGGYLNEVPGAQSATPAINIDELRPDAGDGLSFAILGNPSNSEAVDISGWTLTGIEPIAPGTVILPGQQLAIVTNEPGFRAERPNFNGVRSWADGSLANVAVLQRVDGSTADTSGTQPSAPLVLNEWNAVNATSFIAGGDTTLGSVEGNGGDWFELSVIDDMLDVRGWKLVLFDSDGGPLGIRDTFEFADQPLLASLEAGTIITVSESFADDTTINQVSGDWHINLQANSADDGVFFTAASQENFDTNANEWRLLILDETGDVVFGPAGEGIGSLAGVTSDEVGELQTDPAATVNPITDYGDGDSSTFGLANVTEGQTQDFGDLRFEYVWGDVNCDGSLNTLDAYEVSRLSVDLPTSEFRCPLVGDDAAYEPAGDYSQNGSIGINDAYLVSRCVVNLPGACIE